MTSAGKRKPRNSRASVISSALGWGGGGSAAPIRLRAAAQRNGSPSGVEDNLERARQCPALNLGRPAQDHRDPLALIRGELSVDTVALVAGLPGDVHLGRQQLTP